MLPVPCCNDLKRRGVDPVSRGGLTTCEEHGLDTSNPLVAFGNAAVHDAEDRLNARAPRFLQSQRTVLAHHA